MADVSNNQFAVLNEDIENDGSYECPNCKFIYEGQIEAVENMCPQCGSELILKDDGSEYKDTNENKEDEHEGEEEVEDYDNEDQTLDSLSPFLAKTARMAKAYQELRNEKGKGRGKKGNNLSQCPVEYEGSTPEMGEMNVRDMYKYALDWVNNGNKRSFYEREIEGEMVEFIKDFTWEGGIIRAVRKEIDHSLKTSEDFQGLSTSKLRVMRNTLENALCCLGECRKIDPESGESLLFDDENLVHFFNEYDEESNFRTIVRNVIERAKENPRNKYPTHLPGWEPDGRDIWNRLIDEDGNLMDPKGNKGDYKGRSKGYGKQEEWEDYTGRYKGNKPGYKGGYKGEHKGGRKGYRDHVLRGKHGNKGKDVEEYSEHEDDFPPFQGTVDEPKGMNKGNWGNQSGYIGGSKGGDKGGHVGGYKGDGSGYEGIEKFENSIESLAGSLRDFVAEQKQSMRELIGVHQKQPYQLLDLPPMAQAPPQAIIQSQGNQVDKNALRIQALEVSTLKNSEAIANLQITSNSLNLKMDEHNRSQVMMFQKIMDQMVDPHRNKVRQLVDDIPDIPDQPIKPFTNDFKPVFPVHQPQIPGSSEDLNMSQLFELTEWPNNTSILRQLLLALQSNSLFTKPSKEALQSMTIPQLFLVREGIITQYGVPLAKIIQFTLTRDPSSLKSLDDTPIQIPLICNPQSQAQCVICLEYQSPQLSMSSPNKGPAWMSCVDCREGRGIWPVYRYDESPCTKCGETNYLYYYSARSEGVCYGCDTNEQRAALKSIVKCIPESKFYIKTFHGKGSMRLVNGNQIRSKRTINGIKLSLEACPEGDV